MYKKIIDYIDYNGIPRHDEYHFHLTKPKLAKMLAKFYPEAVKRDSLSSDEYQKIVSKSIKEKEPDELIDMFEYMILQSYGVKSDDGLSFEQSDELSKGFSSTAAYAVLFTELFTDTNAMMDFLNNIIPGDMTSLSNNQPAVISHMEHHEGGDVRNYYSENRFV